MFYIMLDDDMNLLITVKEPIYRGDNLNQKITYLLPKQVGEIDMLSATPYLTYIRADGVADIVSLERKDELYKDSYYQYALPVTCRLSKFPGEVCSWLQIFSGTPSNPTIAKSGECLLQIQDSKNIDDYICDHQLSAIYAMQKQSNEINEDVEELRVEVDRKGDDLIYDAEKQTLQLSSNGNPVGDVIDMSKMVNDDEVIHFSSGDSPDDDDPDAVIHF